MEFESIRFCFVAREAIQFAEGHSSNILRGAFGTIFRRLACVPECHSVRTCDRKSNCPYARLFEPRAALPGPSGLADWPRPFVFRATHLDGRSFDVGQEFYFDLNLFDVASTALDHFTRSFAELAREGLGPNRRRVEMTSVVHLNKEGQPVDTLRITLSLEPEANEIRRLTVRFKTPTELKSAGRIQPQPDFGTVAARARDRISTLRELYGSGPLAIDYREFGERAARVKMTRCDIRTVRTSRRSSRTGQVHSIGGFLGEADYEGALTEFVPYLRAAQWTGIGRQTVWGKGEIEVCIP